MEKGNADEIHQGLLEYLFNQPIKKVFDGYYWISYPHGAYKHTRLTKDDIIDALTCKIDEDGDHYDLTREPGHRCIPKEKEEY